MSSVRVLAASLMVVLASSATSTSAKAEGFPDAEVISDSLRRPRLASCDELVCHYRLGDWYSVRNIRCEAQVEEQVRCSYERTVNRPWEVVVLPPDAPPPSVTIDLAAVETTFKRVGEGSWIVVADSED